MGKRVSEIREKESVDGVFLVTKKECGVSKSGKPYLILRLMDSTGEVESRVWERADEIGACFSKDDVVRVKGFAVAYQGGIQVNAGAITPLSKGEYSLRDFLPSSERDGAEMMAELDGIVASLADPHIKALLGSIFGDPEIRDLFQTAPAAKAMHHPYLGGLIEHVLSLCGLVRHISSHYGEMVNADLLMAGAILHDIGKIYELSYARSFGYTDEGRLIGHITIGVELIDEHIGRIDGFPAPLGVLLKHMILSHHGSLEFGSPKRPKTLEAVLLSFLDDMDAKVAAVGALAADERESTPGWSPFQRIFERYIYKGGEPEVVYVPGSQGRTTAPEEAGPEKGDEDADASMPLFKPPEGA